jgi:hypothetical protein
VITNTVLDIASQTTLTLDEKLSFHLALSFATPINPSMIPTLIEAIDAVESSDSAREIGLPKGVTFFGLPTAPATVLFEDFHLRFFVAAASR